MALVGAAGNGLGLSAQRLQIKDVPPDHWAYEAVATLIERGYLAVYEDGTFDGTRSVDRFTFAATVAKLLESVEQERATVTESDLQLLRRLSTEFRDDLVKVYASVEELETSDLPSSRRNRQCAKRRSPSSSPWPPSWRRRPIPSAALVEAQKASLGPTRHRCKRSDRSGQSFGGRGSGDQGERRDQAGIGADIGAAGEPGAGSDIDWANAWPRWNRISPVNWHDRSRMSRPPWKSAVAKLRRDLDLGLEEKAVAIGLLESQLRQQEKQLGLYGEQIRSLDQRTQGPPSCRPKS
ncbi:MAG: S-layer homology domain-containing protein [Limnochordia bacterium]